MNVARRRFRVAFSFAGEKRDYVAKVASRLASRFGEAAILYDKYHEAEFARRDLGFYLPDLYHKESDLVIVVICQDYESKEWCGLEWDAIFDLLKKRNDQEVMLCRFDHASMKGLYSTAGFMELDDKPAEQTTARILERLAMNEGRPKDHYLSGMSMTARSSTAPREFKAAPSRLLQGGQHPVEYFCYISRNKVDQLYQQLDPNADYELKEIEQKDSTITADARANLGIGSIISLFRVGGSYGKKGRIQRE